MRQKESEIQKDVSDGIWADAQNVTVNDLYKLRKHLKRGLKDNTYQNYCYMYEMFVAEDIGKMCISKLKRSDLKRFYNKLADERKLKIVTIDNIHTVLHQVLQLAVEDNYVRQNVSDNMLKELKQSHTFEEGYKRALTVPEQELFLNFLVNERSQYHHWHPIFTVMLGTGMRVEKCVDYVGRILILKMELLMSIILLFIIITETKMAVILISIHPKLKPETARYQ